MKTLLTTLSLKAIPADWLHRVKVQAAREGVTMKSFILQAVEQAVEEREGREGR
jgi:predicted DNA binding CopG/RHH family protein